MEGGGCGFCSISDLGAGRQMQGLRQSVTWSGVEREAGLRQKRSHDTKTDLLKMCSSFLNAEK